MEAVKARAVHALLREALLVTLLLGAAFLFLNHGLLYFTGDTTPRSTRPEAYVMTTLALYIFVRGIDMVLRLRLPPREEGGLVLCPECGQELDDPTPQGLEAHFREPGTGRPSERDVLAAIALRKALDDARRAAKTRVRRDGLPTAATRRTDNSLVGPGGRSTQDSPAVERVVPPAKRPEEFKG